MKKLHILFLLLIGIAAISCERVFMEADEPANPVNVFDYLWNKVDQQYAFFDVKGVDWDSVYEVYRPNSMCRITIRCTIGCMPKETSIPRLWCLTT